MQVVYIDVLFLINFSMDYLALRMAGGILHLPSGRFALIGASVLGGGYAVAAALFAGGVVLSSLIGIAVALLLCYVAYGRECGRRTFFFLSALFFVFSWLLGGMITAFYQFLPRVFENREELLAMLLEGDGKLPLFFGLSLLAALILALGRRHLTFARPLSRTVQLTVTEGGRSYTFSAFVDSGNTLCDPLSGRPCVVVSPLAFAGIPKDILSFSTSGLLDIAGLSPESRRRIRLVPSESIGGERLLVGFLPERLTLKTGDGEERAVDAILVLDSHQKGGFNGNGALVPSNLII